MGRSTELQRATLGWEWRETGAAAIIYMYYSLKSVYKRARVQLLR